MALAPENSVASFVLAAFSGADEIELDVRVTGDGVPIVLHDPTLDRVAAGPGPFVDTPVTELSLAQVRTVVLAEGQAVPTFAEVLEVTDTLLQVEIKDPCVVEPLVELLEGVPRHLQRVKFTSFLSEPLFRLSLSLPTVRRGLIVGMFPAAPHQRRELDDVLIATGASTLYSGFENLTRTDVERLQAAGTDVHVWPLASAGDIRRALELGVDGGTSDNPAEAREWLAAAGARPIADVYR